MNQQVSASRHLADLLAEVTGRHWTEFSHAADQVVAQLKADLTETLKDEASSSCNSCDALDKYDVQDIAADEAAKVAEEIIKTAIEEHIAAYHKPDPRQLLLPDLEVPAHA